MTIVEGCVLIVALTVVMLALTWINLKSNGRTLSGKFLHVISYWLIIICLLLIGVIAYIIMDGVL